MSVKTAGVYRIFQSERGLLLMKMRKGISAVLAGVMTLAALPVSACVQVLRERMHWAM